MSTATISSASARIEHSLTDYVETELERGVSYIQLQLTQNCNLRCSYCIYSDANDGRQRSHSAKTMPYETAKRAIDFLAVHSIDNEAVSLGFYGGEPLLEFELMKKIVGYAEEILADKELTFHITINGTLLTQEAAEYLMEKNFRITLSLDGPREIHDANRRFAVNGKGSFDVIMANISQLSELCPDYKKDFMLSMVIDPGNEFDEILKISEIEAIKDIMIRTSIVDDSYSKEKITFSEKYTEQREYQLFLAYIAGLGKYGKFEASPIVKEEKAQIDAKRRQLVRSEMLPDKGSHGGPCLPGKSRLFVDVNGLLFPCERVSESSDAMQIGSLEKGFDYEKVKALLNIGSLTAEECRNCWAVGHCMLCAKHCDGGDSLSAERKLTYCGGARHNALEMLKNIVLMKEAKYYYGEKYYD
jgi:uncharacterized protein